MATLSSRIHDLTAAIVAALNTRAQQSASGYDIAKLNGYTGTQAQWLADFSDPGNTDYATQFNNAISSSVPQVSVASETVAGITQLGTLADALAGLSSGKALSVLRHANVHVATTLADLNSKAATLPPGSLVGLAQQDYSNTPSGTNNGYMYRSLWFIDNLQRATPYTPLITTNGQTLTYVVSVAGTGKTYTALYLDPGATEGMVALSGSTTTYRMRYVFNGTAFVIAGDPRASAMAYATGQQAFASGTLTPISTVNIVSDPTGFMAPQGGDGSTWHLPWAGRYRFTVHMCLSNNIAAGVYYGIGCNIVSGISLADIGSRMQQNGGDAFEMTAMFFNGTAGRNMNLGFYHQNSATEYTYTSSGTYTVDDPKTTRVHLEFLGA